VSEPLTIALPKGRVLRAVVPLLARAGADGQALLADDRSLVRESAAGALRFLLLKPDDVPTYVEYGAADLGVCGKDVLTERASDVYQPLDLGVGKCRMVVAGVVGRPPPSGVPRVATK
jgi:ATP phosphoribosyltransferase